MSYIQFSAQQQVTPIYSIFSQKPVKFLAGNYLVQGVLGFNFVYANYLEQLITFNPSSNRYYGNAKGILSLDKMRILFDNGTNIIKHEIIFSDVYISGGNITASVDGNPSQVIYQFVCSSMEKIDSVTTTQ